MVRDRLRRRHPRRHRQRRRHAAGRRAGRGRRGRRDRGLVTGHGAAGRLLAGRAGPPVPTARATARAGGPADALARPGRHRSWSSSGWPLVPWLREPLGIPAFYLGPVVPASCSGRHRPRAGTSCPATAGTSASARGRSSASASTRARCSPRGTVGTSSLTIPIAGVAGGRPRAARRRLAFRLRSLRGEVFALLTLAVPFIVAPIVRISPAIDGGQGIVVPVPAIPEAIGGFQEFVYLLALASRCRGGGHRLRGAALALRMGPVRHPRRRGRGRGSGCPDLPLQDDRHRGHRAASPAWRAACSRSRSAT